MQVQRCDALQQRKPLFDQFQHPFDPLRSVPALPVSRDVHADDGDPLLASYRLRSEGSDRRSVDAIALLPNSIAPAPDLLHGTPGAPQKMAA